MKKRNKKGIDITNLTIDQLENQIKNENYKSRYKSLLKNTIYTIIIIFAFCVLLATLIMPVFEIKGNSMSPTYNDGNIVVALKKSKYKSGDVIAFYYGNKILVKRVIATEGDWVNIKEGIIYTNGREIDKSSSDESFYYGNQEYPYQVPSNGLFVVSDNKSDTQDSRNSQIGCVEKENILGEVLFRLWN